MVAQLIFGNVRALCLLYGLGKALVAIRLASGSNSTINFMIAGAFGWLWFR